MLDLLVLFFPFRVIGSIGIKLYHVRQTFARAITETYIYPIPYSLQCSKVRYLTWASTVNCVNHHQGHYWSLLLTQLLFSQVLSLSLLGSLSLIFPTSLPSSFSSIPYPVCVCISVCMYVCGQIDRCGYTDQSNCICRGW